MKVILPQASIPNNGMMVRSNNEGPNGNQEGKWKMVLDDEARKINPLFDVKIKRNDLILDSIEKNDWSAYHTFQAKQHPAWYEQVNGQAQQNKVYYGSLIESKIRSLKEAQMSGDKQEIAKWEKSLNEAIEDFKNAPGIVPYVVGLNHTAELAAQYGVRQPGDDFYNSKWNSSLVMSQGKFEQNMWYDNAYFKENEDIKKQVESVVSGIFPTSTDQEVIASKEDVKPPVEDIVKDDLTESRSESEKPETLQTMFLQNTKLNYTYKPDYKWVQQLYS